MKATSAQIAEMYAFLGGAVVFAGMWRIFRGRMKSEGLIILIGRFVAGKPWHGKPVTDAGWSRKGKRALTPTGHASWFWHQSGKQRLVIRATSTLLVVLTAAWAALRSRRNPAQPGHPGRDCAGHRRCLGLGCLAAAQAPPRMGRPAARSTLGRGRLAGAQARERVDSRLRRPQLCPDRAAGHDQGHPARAQAHRPHRECQARPGEPDRPLAARRGGPARRLHRQQAAA